jgi:glutamine---fructose-6-phosphate transaminase (isomerizing)
MEPGAFTIQEILTQTDAWSGALREVKFKKDVFSHVIYQKPRQLIFTGCGSTYYLALAAASLFQSQTGFNCKAVPAGELWMNPETVYTDGKSLLFAISRSGSTSETIRAVKYFKHRQGGPVICITNWDDQPLAEMADLTFWIPEGQEKSIAQTRSFSSMFLTATAAAMIAAKSEGLLAEMQSLPDIGRNFIARYHEVAKGIGENLDVDRFYFLGSGHRYGIACEASLKMKEMTQTHTEPFHFLEFRHGPKSMVNDRTIVVGLLSDSKREVEEKVLTEMAELGGRVVSIAEHNAEISFDSGLAENIRTILYLPVLQLMAYYRSIAKGLDPDRPKNLSSVIYLE